LSKVDKIFNPKSRETKFKLAQARPNKFGRIRLTYSNRNMNANIEIVFRDFLKINCWTYVVYDLDGRIEV